jgi:hypothetical protein
MTNLQIFGGLDVSYESVTPSSAFRGNDLLTPAQLAGRLGVTTRWVNLYSRRTYTKDPIPHVRFGKFLRYRWDSAEFQSWLKRRIK